MLIESNVVGITESIGNNCPGLSLVIRSGNPAAGSFSIIGMSSGIQDRREKPILVSGRNYGLKILGYAGVVPGN